MEELESLEDRARAVAASIGKAVSGVLILKHDAEGFRQETYIRDLNLEFTNIIELAESVKSTQVATATLYKDWQDIKLAEITPPKTSFFSSTRTQNQKLWRQMDQQKENERGANVMYCDQGESRNNDY